MRAADPLKTDIGQIQQSCPKSDYLHNLNDSIVESMYATTPPHLATSTQERLLV